MIICVFDTETTSLDKPFCYNIGYVIANIENSEILISRDFVVEQTWHNLPLFESAYYADKRPLYINRMRARQAIMDKFGYICAQMRRDFKTYGVEVAYAFNSSFDERVFSFNCDWYKCLNPFEEVPVYDIRAYAVNTIGTTAEYKRFCEEHNLFTDNGNYQSTAESFFKYLFDVDFVEEHTALADAVAEYEILKYLEENETDISQPQESSRYIERRIAQEWTIQKGKETITTITAEKMTVYKKWKKIKFE